MHCNDGHRPNLRAPMPALLRVLCVAFVMACVSFSGVVSAQDSAKDLDRANQALFLAVDRNDLPGVRAAIQAGADVEATGYSSMPVVDLAIERGYFDIAHYLISVRNAKASGDAPPAPAPSPKQLADAAQAPVQPAPAQRSPAPEVKPAPALPQGQANPFDAPRAAGDLPVIKSTEPPAELAEAPKNVAPEQIAELAEEPAKKSAAKTFVTTFLNFFDEPNTTGVIQKPRAKGTGAADAVTDTELSKQLHEIEAERGDDIIKGPAVPISPEELAKQLPPAPDVPAGIAAPEGAPLDTPELPPYALEQKSPERTLTAPPPGGEDPFGEIEVAEVTAEDNAPPPGSAPPKSMEDQLLGQVNPNLPFGGGVDPAILALIGEAPAPVQEEASAAVPDPFASPATPEDPFAAPPATTEDPFAAPADGESAKTETAEADPFAAPAPDGEGASADPFAAPPGETDELAGLFEAPPDGGWDVKKVEGGASDGPVVAVLNTIAPTGEALDGIDLTLGLDTSIGKEVGDDRMTMMEEETIHKPCLEKGGPDTMFCIDTVNWPFDLEDDFQVDTIMYQGTRAVGRYDAGRASHYHVLFNTAGFERVIGFYIERYGQPAKKVDRAIAPLAAPRTDNPTYIWQSREAGTDTITTLEVRKFDDVRDSFPDTKRGVILLYRSHAGEIFPLLSQLELMVLKPDGVSDLTPKTADAVWGD